MFVSAILVVLASRAWATSPPDSNPVKSALSQNPAPYDRKPSVTIIPSTALASSLHYTPPKGPHQPYGELDPKYQSYVDQALDAIYESLGIVKPSSTETHHVTIVHIEATPGVGLMGALGGVTGGGIEFSGRGEQVGEIGEEAGAHVVRWDV